MAYARYGPDCQWYIFWQQTREDPNCGRYRDARPKEDESLAIWHCDHRASGPLFTYADVSQMLSTGDFSCIPGYSEDDRELLAACLAAFIKNVDDQHGAT